MGGPLDANIWRSLESLKKYEQEDCGCKKQFEKIEKAKVDLLRKTKKMKHYLNAKDQRWKMKYSSQRI
ncbi:MAG: hypothetical protein QXH03_01635 [Candidatus Bathyarchaeia archaeon]